MLPSKHYSKFLCIFLSLLFSIAFTQSPSSADTTDHVSHSVPGPDRTVRDEDGDGFAEVTLNGELSHTHYFRPGPPSETGYLVSYKWTDTKKGTVIGNEITVTYKFPVGATVISLTVVDNSGDSSTENCTVTVLPSGEQGAYLYFYDLSTISLETDAKTLPKLEYPQYGIPVKQVNFPSPDTFPKVPFISEGPFATKVMTYFQVMNEDKYTLFVAHGGGAVVFKIDDKVILSKMTIGTQQKISITKPMDMKLGEHKFELLYYNADPTAAQLILGMNTKNGVNAISPSYLSYESSVVVPTLHSMTPAKSTVGGGGMVKIFGAGFTSDTKVKVGPFDAEEVYVKSDGEIHFKVPSSSAPADVLVRVTTPRGVSNPLPFKYTKKAPMPIKFQETYITDTTGANYTSSQFTSVAVGPDLRYYFGSLDSHIHVLTASHSKMVVHKSCKSKSVGSSRSVTAVAFDPAEKSIRAYISTNTFYYRNWKLMSDADGWHNGKIETFVPGKDSEDKDVCLVHEKDVVTGLPVSNHDHGVNSIVFDHDGNLYVQVGGTTNAGYSEPDDLVGGVPESPLSAATVVVHLRAPGFNGKITYDQYKDPGTAKKTSPDKFVEGFGYGFRNSYGSVFHTNGNIYATDNGPNKGYGQRSVTCNSEGPDPWHKDSLVLVHKDGYFGFPNRNRGLNGDSRQCVYYSPEETSRNGFTAALATFEASTNGLIEYTSNTFQGQLKGDLLASKYAVAGTGKLYRISLDATGKKMVGAVEELAKFSGLSIALNPFGIMIMPRVQQPNIAVLIPDEEEYEGNAPVLNTVMPNRGPKSGGNYVAVTGQNISKDAKIFFSDKPCQIKRRGGTNDWVLCKVPAGSGAVKVVITTMAGETKSIDNDYYYMNL